MFKKKLSLDFGSAVSTFAIWSIIGITMISIFVVDTVKLIYVKNVYFNYAKRAVEIGAKMQDSIGGIKPESAQALIDEYMVLRNGGTKTVQSVGSIASTTKINEQSRETKNYIGGCGASYPKFNIKYDTRRTFGASGASYSASGGSYPTISNPSDFYKNQYRVIQVEVTDVTSNFFWGMFGNQCSEVKVGASAISVTHFDEED